MIRLIDDINATKISLRDSHYSQVILSHIKTYGSSYSFCEFYELVRGGKRIGLFSSFNGSVAGDTLEGATPDRYCIRETAEFISFKNPYSAELAPLLSGRAGINGYIRVKRSFYEIPAGKIPPGLNSSPNLEAVYKTAFGDSGEEYGIWLTDTVRRRNMGLLRVFSLGGSCLTVRFCGCGRAYICDVATPVEERGHGQARALMMGVSSIYSEMGYSCYLAADESTKDYYDHIGFKTLGGDYVYKFRSGFDI